MPEATYNLIDTDWTDCGAADDATVQLRTNGAIIATVGTAKPDISSRTGLTFTSGGKDNLIEFRKAGLRIWARSVSGPFVIVAVT